MILFNSMFIRGICENNLVITQKLNFINYSIEKTNVLSQNTYSIAMIQSPSYYYEGLIAKKYALVNKKVNNLTNQKLISRNFMTRLLNKYWQETIFLSKSNLLSENYTNQLKSDGISVYKNQYKKFLADFSKALIAGRIEVSLKDELINNIDHDNSHEIKYIWKKGLNFALPTNSFYVLKNKTKLNFSSKMQVKLLIQLKQNRLPVFTLVNNFNQIIVAEPSDELINNQHIIDKMYQWYYDRFLWQKDNKPMYEGLFFINPEDALEYKNHTNSKYSTINQNNNISIFASGLDFYYKLIKISPPKVQFNLIPDLKELGQLIYKHQYNKNISFHARQKYNKYCFQGQPIYIIKPILAKNQQTKQIKLINYTYNSRQNDDTIFMNYEIALLAWQKFIQKNIDYKLPNQPQILVYNLEDFLNTYESNYQNNDKNLLFVPTQESYKFIQNNSFIKSQKTIYQGLINRLVYFKIFTQRVIWSLTSRQPVNW